ncbi:MAG: Gfo/Idh/MocA family oxidoreductase [Candidatus Omnitrophica bacterium]|nr:Gfo/Idh/MocA family oxidoreductase [Candidatus Omnitrophota bacterium]
MKKLKVGVVGLSRGRGFVSVFSAHPELEISALCDIDENKLADVGDAFGLPDKSRFTDFDDFLNADTDIVMIATPIPFHADQSIKSLQAGKHVLCEQTVAYTVEECEKVVEAVKKSGKKFMMAENYCYFHYIREWKKIVEAGKKDIWKIVALRARVLFTSKARHQKMERFLPVPL